MLNIFLFNNCFEIKVFFEKTVKNCFGDTFDHFLGKGAVLHQKITEPFLSQIRYRIFNYGTFFSKSFIFQKNGKTLFLGAKFVVNGKGCLVTKMNIISFMVNEFWILLHLTIFKESNNFCKNGEKNVWGIRTFFRRGSHYAKNKYNLFYRKLDAKYFHVKEFFRKKQYISRKVQKLFHRLI